jgi:hypothetical protein
MTNLNLKISVVCGKEQRREFCCPLAHDAAQWFIASVVTDQGGFVTNMPAGYAVPVKEGDWIRTSIGPVYMTIECSEAVERLDFGSLTMAQRRAFNEFMLYFEANMVAPTVREMTFMLGLSPNSTCAVHNSLHALEAKGWLRRPPLLSTGKRQSSRAFTPTEGAKEAWRWQQG